MEGTNEPALPAGGWWPVLLVAKLPANDLLAADVAVGYRVQAVGYRVEREVFAAALRPSTWEATRPH